MERLVQARIGNHMYCIHLCMDIHVICDYTREISSTIETLLVYYIIAVIKMSGLDSLLNVKSRGTFIQFIRTHTSNECQIHVE